MSQLTLAVGFGLVTSAILALGAVGFTLQFGVSNIFNLAYGNVMTVAAFVAYLVNVRAGQSIWWAVGAGAGAGAALCVRSSGGSVAPGAVAVAARWVSISRVIYAPFLRGGAELFTMVMVSLAVS